MSKKLSALKQNSVVKGRVVGIRRYGAFIELLETDDLGIRQTGLIHISEIAETLVKHQDLENGKYFKLGEIINVRIKDIGEKKGKTRVSLSIKNVEQDNLIGSKATIIGEILPKLELEEQGALLDYIDSLKKGATNDHA